MNARHYALRRIIVGQPCFVLSCALVMYSCSLLSGCKAQKTGVSSSAFSTPSPAQNFASSNPRETNGDAERELEAIGEKIAAAILAKDIDTLLTFDRVDLRAEDERSLRDPTSNLYLSLFYSGTYNDKDKGRSVYDILSSAKQLKVDASVTKAPDGRQYGLLLFYDKSQISENQLNSKFFCTDEALKRIASWHFIRTGTKWNATTPLFDQETDALCSD